MANLNCTLLILAAGKGTRMKSSKPKVLHEIAGLSLIGHVLAASHVLNANKQCVVIGPDMDDVAAEIKKLNSNAVTAIQTQQLGTGDAVKAGLAAIQDVGETVLVLYGDTPLIKPDTLVQLCEMLQSGSADIALLGFHADNPHGYGRLILDQSDNLTAIREQADASEQESQIDLCNSGIMVFKTQLLQTCLEALTADNANNEYYLTDCIEIASKQGAKITVVTCPETEVQGINTQAQLATCEAVMQTRLRAHVMANGTTLLDPDSVYLSFDTKIAADVVIEPNVIFAPGVSIGRGTTIRGFSHLEGAEIGENVAIGPFARLRPGAKIKQNAKIGNFVEVKAATIEEGAKVNHLSYIGDARVGSGANVGAGTITCNYDGFAKHFTDIGKHAFIGSNTALVAPVKIGDGAIIGAGSVVADNVEANALAITRAKFVVKANWAENFRNVQIERKTKK